MGGLARGVRGAHPSLSCICHVCTVMYVLSCMPWRLTPVWHVSVMYVLSCLPWAHPSLSSLLLFCDRPCKMHPFSCGSALCRMIKYHDQATDHQLVP